MEFTFKTDLDPIAILALIVSSFAFAISFATYFSDRVRLNISGKGDLISIPDDGLGNQIKISISNNGKRSTTLESITFSNSRSANVARQLLPTNPRPKQFPLKLEPGGREVFYFYQDRMVTMIGNTIFAHIHCSHARSPKTVKVIRERPKRP